MKSITVRFCAVILLISLMLGCRNGGDSERSSSQDITTAPTPVSLQFFGTIAHLLGPKNKRAVFMRNDHRASMKVLKGITEADLKKAWPANEVVCKPDCVVPLTDRSIQFSSKGEVITQPSTITQLPSFKNTVPHLAAVTGSPQHGKFNDIQKEVMTTDPPDSGNRISSWLELPGGDFSATLNKWTGRFDPDHEGTMERDFGEDITLSATIDTPTLVVRKGADKWEIPIDPGGVILRFENEPINGKQHFHLFYDLASGPLTAGDERPRIRPIKKKYAAAPDQQLLGLIYKVLDKNMKHTMKTEETGREEMLTRRERALIDILLVEVPGCSNSQWP